MNPAWHGFDLHATPGTPDLSSRSCGRFFCAAGPAAGLVRARLRAPEGRA